MNYDHRNGANGKDEGNVIDLGAKRRQKTLTRKEKIASGSKGSARLPKSKLSLYIQFAFFLAVLAYFLRECH